MAEENKKGLLYDTWFQIIVGALVFAPIGNIISERIKVIPLLSPILSVFSFVWLKLLNFKVPIWIILVLSLIVYIVSKFVNVSPPKKASVIKPAWFSWKQGKLKKWNWSWEYRFDILTSRYEVENLRVICDKCDFQMLNDYRGYHCPNCDNSIFNVTEDQETIKDLIIQRIRSDKYPKLRNEDN